jgi:tetratricopeptide (TPR) repeat protein
MSEEESVAYFNSPLYQELLTNFQRGDWEAGLSQLDKLMEKFPLEHELRALRSEMQIRASIDKDESHDRASVRWYQTRTWILRLLIFAGFAAVMFWGVRSYYSWINLQWDRARTNLVNRVESLDLSIKYRNAQNLILANRPEEAKSMLAEVANLAPDFPGLKESMGQADTMIALESAYNEAIRLVASGDYPAALTKFEEISAQSPNYKDVNIQIAEIKKNYLLTESFDKAERAYFENRWVDAIDWYENVHSSDPQFRSDYIEERLFNSYINAAEAALSKPSNTMTDLSRAEDYYRKALAIRPRDAQIIAKRAQARSAIEDRLVNSYLKSGQEELIGKADSIAALQAAEKYFDQALMLRPGDNQVYHQVELAQNYLKGVDNYQKGLWSDAIKNLELVYKADNEYADGTARQTLYEAYISRGNAGLAAGDYEDSLLDFQRAALIAQQGPDSILRLFEAQLKIADTNALLGSYKEAVQIYQAAIELGGLRAMAEEKKSKLTDSLAKADLLADVYSYKAAYQVYSSALHDITDLYKMDEVMVSNGDYLTMLARRYNSTVDAILAANNLHDESDLTPNTKIRIPNLQGSISMQPQ